MNYYAVIKEDGSIQAPVAMSRVYKGKSGFDLLTDKERQKFGWYPCELVNHDFDEETQMRSSQPVCRLEGDKMICEYVISEISDVYKKDLLDRLKTQHLSRYWVDVTITEDDKEHIIQFRNEGDMWAIQGVLLEAMTSPSTKVINFRTKNNEYLELESSEMVTLLQNILAEKSDLLAKYWDLKDTAQSLSTVEELRKFDLEAGW